MVNSLSEQYNRQGFILQKAFFDEAEIGRIKEDAIQVFINQMKHLALIPSADLSEQQFEEAMAKYFLEDADGFINCGKTCQHLISLHRLSLTSSLLNQLQELGLQT